MRFILALLIPLALSLGNLAWAQTGPWDDNFDFSRVRLVAAKDTLDSSNKVQLGLEFDVAEGWNIYWRSPGPVGLPPAIIWEDLSQIQESQIAWPVPARYTYSFPGEDTGIESMIYKGNTILPIEVTLADPGQPLFARAIVEYMVCNEQCIFGEANVSIDLFVGGNDAPLSVHAPRINEFLSQVPAPNDPAAGLGLSAHRYDAAAQVISFDLHSPVAMTAPDVFIEAPEQQPGFTFGNPAVKLSNDGFSAQVVVPVDELAYSGATPADTDFRLTLIDDKRGVDLGFVRVGSDQGISNASWAQASGAGSFGLAAAGAGFGPDGWTIWILMLAAIAAGAILNLMPCVLPVLSLKLMAFVGKADKDNREIRTSFLATAAGIVVSFLLLAGLVVAFQQLGVAVGWGFQFQSPWFVSAMAAVMVVFAANMFGWFELPNIPGLGAVGAGQKGPAADFMTGALATLLATPCSAPLLAPVIGIAFAGEPTTIFGLFVLIGLGMAAPYWLVVLFPAIARAMPKPGAWMLMLKGVLGVMLLGFALFMMFVLMTQLGAWVAGLALALSLIVLMVLFLRKNQPNALAPALVAFAALTVVPVAGASFLPNQQLAWFNPAPSEDDIQWLGFDEAEIVTLVEAGNTVFVDVTASWCVNCKFNKAIALDPEPVKKVFAQDDVVAMIADWTNHDADIGVYLAKFGRAGIPFNIVYSPSNPGGEVLPTALTQDIVLRALDSKSL